MRSKTIFTTVALLCVAAVTFVGLLVTGIFPADAAGSHPAVNNTAAYIAATMRPATVQTGEPSTPLVSASLGLYDYPNQDPHVSMVAHDDGTVEKQGCDGSVLNVTGEVRVEGDAMTKDRLHPSVHFNVQTWVGPVLPNGSTNYVGSVYHLWRHQNVPHDNVFFTNVPAGSLNSGWEYMEDGIQSEQFPPGSKWFFRSRITADDGKVFDLTCIIQRPAA